METVHVTNRHLLPKNFLVKANMEHPRWMDYIRFLNKISDRSWGGDGESLHYGLTDNNSVTYSAEYESIDLYTVMELDEVMQLLETNVETVETYNGESHPMYLCVQIHSGATQHPEEWALKSECRYASLDDGYALPDDVYSLNNGDTFLENSQEYHDIVWSEYENDYLVNGDDICYGWVSRRTQDYFIGGNEELYIDGECYLDDDVARQHDYMYSERRDEWVHCDNWETGHHDWEEDESESNNADYHDLTRVNKFDSSAKFTIGFEIEKEDSDMVSVDYSDLYHNTSWIKERDGSLDDDIGYELVSPAFNLFDDRLDQDINNSRVLRDLINADKSSRCGGHINIGSSIYNTTQLFEGLSGFFPLLYAMYEGRLDKTYSKAKKKHEYYQRDKYSSIYIKDHVVEIRIPSAVVNVQNLLWRRDLVRIMVDNINKSELQVLRMMLNEKSKLHIHLRKVYSIDAIIGKIKKFIKYSDEFNNKKLPSANTTRLENKMKNESKLNETLEMAC
jgi:hypothetical protein